MGNILRAEWQKMVGNKWVTGFLIWLFPAGAFGFVSLMYLFGLLSPDFRENIYAVGGPPLWTNAFLGPWSFANNLFGRTFLLAFTAVTFAGEYQWGTWKNIIPRQQRSRLIIAKFINLSALILLSFTLMSCILGFGQIPLTRLADVAYGPELTSAVLKAFLNDYAIQAILTFIAVLISAIYSALAALLMKSILGGVMVGMGIAVTEPLVFAGSISLAGLFDTVFFLHLARFTPYYSIENVRSWVNEDQAISWFGPFFEMFNTIAPTDTMSFSLMVLAGWVIVGFGLVLYLFQRQDITT